MTRFPIRRFLAAAAALVLAAGLVASAAPGAAAPRPAGAAHTVTFDKYSLKIDGKRIYLWAGEFHYWRLPSPDLWRDVLEKMKAAGYNAATIYFDWGYHSPAPGVYDFSGVRDVDKLLDIADQVGIYVIARQGPYINAETDGGGFPGWLNRMHVSERSPDPEYLKYADEWLSHIDPIIARHQLTNGTGTVILDQVENEYYDGSASGREYMQHLEDKYRADGITVPLTGNHNGTFNSGSGALDIDGWDSYPQGFNCANPSHWNQVPDYSSTRDSLTDRPLYFPEYQGGAFDAWGGSGYGNCRQLTDSDFEKVFYDTNIAAGSTMQSFYMTYGGTSWGYLPYPGVYTSYDYGSAIAEDRELTDKYQQQKLTGYFLAAATPLTKTDALSVAPPDNPDLWLKARVNPDDGTQLYVLRHNDGTSTADDSTHLSMGGYTSVPQQPGTAIAVNGRDAKMLLANYAFGGQRMMYSTSQLMTDATIDGRDVALLYDPNGEDGETVLRYDSEPTVTVLSGSVQSTWDGASGDLRLDYTHDGLARVRISGGGRRDLELLLADTATAKQFWRQDTSAGPVLVRGPELVRGASYGSGTLALTGDTDASTDISIWAPSAARNITWNGTVVKTSGGSVRTATLAGPKPVSLPALTWRSKAENPEIATGFDDSSWTLADHSTTQNPAGAPNVPVLYADDYGYHHGNVWYRGHFTATGTETGILLNANTGNSTGQYSAWLNGHYLGTANGAHQFPIPDGVLDAGQDNVFAVLVANMGHDEGTGMAPRGLLSARLLGSTASLTWRIQGDRGGEDPIDSVRGPLNNGGLYGERAGWSLPGYPDGSWHTASLPRSSSTPGITWYRSEFSLHLPAGQDVPVALRFADGDASKAYRVQIYLNGWNMGLYVNDVGPQHDFQLPTGLLNPRGHNTLALAVWSTDTNSGLGSVSLVAQANLLGGVPVSMVDSPAYEPGRYAQPAAPAHVTVAAPDEVERGQRFTATATVSVPAGQRPARDASVMLSVPDGWQVAGPSTVDLGTIAPGGSASTQWTVTAPDGDVQPWGGVLTATATVDGRTVDGGKTVAVRPPAPSGTVYVSDLPFTATNGWGPVERDTSNGEDQAGDGNPMTLDGTVYAKGLGVHANSDVTVYLGGACTRYTAVVGVDDEVGSNGSVRFSVYADGVEVASTAVLTGTSAPMDIDADVTGAQQLDLVVDDAGDGNGSDHSDWADATLVCQ